MSLSMHAVAGALRLVNKRTQASTAAADRRLAATKRPSTPPARLRSRHQLSCRRVLGFDSWTVRLRSAGSQAEAHAVLYLHGGAYSGQIMSLHWSFISRLADAGHRVEVPIYGLAPQHTYREAYPMVAAVYEQLLQEVDATALTIAGDSAGGGLALGFAQTLVASGQQPPGRLLLIAPWLDLTLGNPDIPAVEAHDPMLARAGLIEIGQAWAGGEDRTQPRLSPLNGSLGGLPPMDVYIGTRDLLQPDVMVLQKRAADQGAHMSVTICQGAVHIYPLTPTPEGRTARAAILKAIAC